MLFEKAAELGDNGVIGRADIHNVAAAVKLHGGLGFVCGDADNACHIVCCIIHNDSFVGRRMGTPH